MKKKSTFKCQTIVLRIAFYERKVSPNLVISHIFFLFFRFFFHFPNKSYKILPLNPHGKWKIKIYLAEMKKKTKYRKKMNQINIKWRFIRRYQMERCNRIKMRDSFKRLNQKHAY